MGWSNRRRMEHQECLVAGLSEIAMLADRIKGMYPRDARLHHEVDRILSICRTGTGHAKALRNLVTIARTCGCDCSDINC